MSNKNLPLISPYAYRKPPKDIDFHFIINEAKYVEDLIDNRKLAYDNDVFSTIKLLARYYRNYKGLSKSDAEDKIFYWLFQICPSSWIVTEIDKACSANRLRYGQAGLPLRDFDGVYVTKKEIDTIKQLDSLEEQQLLFTIVCFTRMYNESNRRNDRKINNLFYVENSVLRRCAGFKKGYKIDTLLNSLYDKGYLGFVNNRDKYFYVKPSRQPMYSRQCCIVDNEGENYFYVDNFDRLDLTYRMILGDKKVKQCECGRYFEANSNRQKKCKRCNPKTEKKVRKHKKF